jgi:alkaline phosphatase
MDDMLGTMLDIDDSVKVMIDWISENGGWEKNALYVTADHDHYLTLNDQFPEALAHFIIEGETYKMTPENNSNKNPWDTAIKKGRHDDVDGSTQQQSQSTSEHIQDFATWTPEDVEAVAHFWGPRAAGGNGWGSHSTRPVPLFYAGDDGCVEALKGESYHVLGREVEGTDDMIDQVHLHACMMKSLFGLGNDNDNNTKTTEETETAPAEEVTEIDLDEDDLVLEVEKFLNGTDTDTDEDEDEDEDEP